jgi:hypothetical protein
MARITHLPMKLFPPRCHRIRERLSYLLNGAVKKLVFTLAFFTSHPYPIHTSSSPRSALPSFTGSSNKEGPMVCGGDEARMWSLSPQRGGWVPVSPIEGRRSSPVCPPLGSASPHSRQHFLHLCRTAHGLPELLLEHGLGRLLGVV